MKYRLAILLFLCSVFTAGCARMTNLMSIDGSSGIPELTEPELPDE